jgi:UDP-N-acetyl-D-galactosamine dehydrogenase
MGKHVAMEVVKLIIKKDLRIVDSKVLILSITFKENCPDVRNTKVIDIYHELISFGIGMDVYDPWASPQEVLNEYNIEIHYGDVIPDLSIYSAVILAVSHHQFKDLDIKNDSSRVIYDVKGFLPKDQVDARL